MEEIKAKISDISTVVRELESEGKREGSPDFEFLTYLVGMMALETARLTDRSHEPQYRVRTTQDLIRILNLDTDGPSKL